MISEGKDMKIQARYFKHKLGRAVVEELDVNGNVR
jgi:hypothetical protein